ncbi:PaaI family thioesterase [Amycolatopsis sp. YIM 10]|uniref:PaaI family thioesterase n=1 Tax=Amycolatopsis sp. YIM 10 TaxID=2653857 RepID=UPI00128FFDDD|nr:PaaI family thioesterase [Amycolatopsis sp. YIM 10]QFU86021.1 Putative esterase [Amycolatopsis sp. YIM 10]
MTDFAKLIPFAERLGIDITEATAERVHGRVDWAADLTTTGGSLHGGLLMALADTTGAVCAFLNLPDGAQGATTIESKTNFLRGVREGHVVASSKPLHAGRRVIVVETELRDAAEKLIAKVTQTQAVL